MSELSCREAVEELWSFLDGELPEERADEVHRHLEACRGCYPHYDYQRAFREFLRARSGAAIPPGLRRRVFLRLLAEEAGGA